MEKKSKTLCQFRNCWIRNLKCRNHQVSRLKCDRQLGQLMHPSTEIIILCFDVVPNIQVLCKIILAFMHLVPLQYCSLYYGDYSQDPWLQLSYWTLNITMLLTICFHVQSLPSRAFYFWHFDCRLVWSVSPSGQERPGVTDGSICFHFKFFYF